MKRLFIITNLMLFGFLASGQEREERKLGSFDEVRISQGIDAYLEKGSTESVRIEVRGIR